MSVLSSVSSVAAIGPAFNASIYTEAERKLSPYWYREFGSASNLKHAGNLTSRSSYTWYTGRTGSSDRTRSNIDVQRDVNFFHTHRVSQDITLEHDSRNEGSISMSPTAAMP